MLQIVNLFLFGEEGIGWDMKRVKYQYLLIRLLWIGGYILFSWNYMVRLVNCTLMVKYMVFKFMSN